MGLIGLIEAYQRAETICREEHVPVLFHVQEMTQPQGHSTRVLTNVINQRSAWRGKLSTIVFADARMDHKRSDDFGGRSRCN